MNLTNIRNEMAEMSPTQRRRFLKLMGACLAAPTIPAALRFAFNEVAGGVKYAHAQAASEGTIFLEFNYRDQVDLMHVFVPPGIATHPSLKPGVNGEAISMFHQVANIRKAPNTNHYLTPDSMELLDYVDDIAIIDTSEATIGNVHGHEAGSAIRSPGRVMGSASGKQPMYMIDAPNDGANGAGSEKLYTSTPTPATLHNYHQKQTDATLKNGFAFKGISRFKHSCYHYGADLPGSELDRYKDKDSLFSAFPKVATDASLVPSPAHADLLLKMVKGVDTRLFTRRYAPEKLNNHLAQLNETRNLLHVANPKVVDVPLTMAEEMLWGEGVPTQKCTQGDTKVVDCGTNGDPSADGFVKAQVWEQFAYAAKILGSGVTRSAAIEFDFMDLHGDGARPESVLQVQAQQASKPLARMIKYMKDLGVWHRTLIAVYTLDGSRRPAANSYGNDGKGTMILAGGMIKGGYYGDIRITKDMTNGHEYGFVKPDPVTGVPTGDPITSWGDPSKRTPGADLWLTVMKALGIPDELARSFPDTTNGTVHQCMLKSV
ncbi:MAG TPA: hypothetical protein VJN18_15755 [Polyangiaceae bacterium]|nr:hypothetical protein [Polyangiaceae bacterium]